MQNCLDLHALQPTPQIMRNRGLIDEHAVHHKSNKYIRKFEANH
jgi:hypothetical protein